MADLLKSDLCIIGRGATGIALALRARQRGAEVVLIDRGVPEPGDPAHGLIARAGLLASAARAHAIATAEAVGLEAAAPRPSFRSIGEHTAALAAATTPEHAAERLTALGVVERRGAPVFTDRNTLSCGETTIKARHFVLATGARPALPQVDGLDSVPFFTPDTVLSAVRKFSHLVVIGGEPAALELAQAYRRLGAEVTLVPQGPLLAGFDPELVTLLATALTGEGIDIRTGFHAVAVQKRSQGTGVEIVGPEGNRDTLDVSHILVAHGRAPELNGEWLSKAGLKLHPDHPTQLLLDADGRTSNRRITAIGGAAGDTQPADTVRKGERLLDRLLGGRSTAVPALRHVATEPALAEVGVIPAGTKPRPGFTVHRASLAENNAARALGATQGSAKLVVSARGQIVGGGVVGTGAGETVALIAQAIAHGAPAAGFAHLALPEPSAAAVLVMLGRDIEAASAPPRRGSVLRRLLG